VVNRKKVLIILGIFFLTGCSVDYTISIEKEFIKEEIKILDKNSNYSGTGSLEDIINDIIDYNKDETNFHSYYDMTSMIGTSESGISLKYDYSIDAFQINSVILNTCYDDVIFSFSNNMYNIKTTGKYKCDFYTKEKVTVNIIASDKYVFSNAHKIDGNVHSWVIDPRKDNNDIELIFAFEKSAIPFSKKIGDFNQLFIFVIILSILSFIIYLYYKKKIVFKNKI
jgi:hypothetical protein